LKMVVFPALGRPIMPQRQLMVAIRRSLGRLGLMEIALLERDV